MSRKFFALLILFHLLLISCFPVWQAFQTGGYVFYTNAIDESGYLQFDTAKLAVELSKFGRTSSYLVMLGHQLGLSGGYLNLIFDGLSLVLVVILLRSFFSTLGLKNPEIMAFSVIDFPIFILNCNPLVNWLFHFNLESGGIAWLSMPWSFSPPIARSPEPQISLAALLAATLIGLKYKTFLPVYCVLPFLYYFISIPTALVALTLNLRGYLGRYKFADCLSILVAFVALGSVLWAYQTFLMDDYIRTNLLWSRLPLVSFSGIIAIVLAISQRKSIPGDLKFPVLILALAGTLVENLQIITGSIMYPNNIEQYFGVTACALVAATTIGQNVQPKYYLSVACGLFVFWSVSSSVENLTVFNRIPFSTELVQDLRHNAKDVVINDLKSASFLDLVLARQDFTGLSFYRSSWTFRTNSLPGYACIRQYLISNPELNDKFAETIARTDLRYTLKEDYYPLLNLKRQSASLPRSVNFSADHCLNEPKVYLTRESS